MSSVSFNEVRARIEGGGHGLAFHSFDHDMERPAGQLAACRKIDLRAHGYRTPRSIVTPELNAKNLRDFAFDWLASARTSLNDDEPTLKDRIVYIPVHFDDYPLYRAHDDYRSWERRALETIESLEVAIFGLHDCYAENWLPHYPAFLNKLACLGSPITLDELADRVFLAHSV